MDLTLVNNIIKTLYDDVKGYDLSYSARKKFEYYDRGFTYGEIVPESVQAFVQEVDPKEGEIFYDLGSGTGKGVLSAALFFPFAKVVGVELLDGLHEASENVLKRFHAEIAPGLVTKKLPIIEFHHADFLAYDMSDADVIFAHATCFHDSLMKSLTKKLEGLKKGARVLVVSKTIESPSYRLTARQEYTFSWGNATLHSYEKVV